MISSRWRGDGAYLDLDNRLIMASSGAIFHLGYAASGSACACGPSSSSVKPSEPRRTTVSSTSALDIEEEHRSLGVNRVKLPRGDWPLQKTRLGVDGAVETWDAVSAPRRDQVPVVETDGGRRRVALCSGVPRPSCRAVVTVDSIGRSVLQSDLCCRIPYHHHPSATSARTGPHSRCDDVAATR